jgi:hypothetical protein
MDTAIIVRDDDQSKIMGETVTLADTRTVMRKRSGHAA